MKKILVIEDQQEIRHLYNVSFSQKGYEVVEASNGEEGLALALAGGFAAILTDLKMPGKDGLEILKTLNQQTKLALNGPIFVISSVAYPFAQEEAIRQGAAGFILKDTMDPMDIVKMVEDKMK